MSANLTIPLPVWLDRFFTWPVLLYRRRKFGYSYRRIYLGEGFYAIVDPADYYQLNKYHWAPRMNNNCIYAFRFVNEFGKKTKIISMHRDIMKPRKGVLVDHRNGKALDNRRSNLRFATRAQNMQNRGKIKKKTSSRYIGVYQERRTGRWVACIAHRGGKISLGTHGSEIEAAKAYDRAAKKFRGEFARLNFPEDI